MARKTRLESFLVKHKLRPIDLANTGACSRQHLFRLRAGKCNPRLQTMRALKTACTSLLGCDVAVADLFEVEPR
jgi:predicted transcriptional regulator